MKSKVFMVLVLSLMAGGCSTGVKVERLRCEYLVNPLGVDVVEPRLSWNLQSGQRGQKQTSYRLLVASSPEKLKKNIGDLWDSGKVKTDRSIHVSYNGKPIESDRYYYWKVKIWDKDGMPSSFSRAAFWETGLLSPVDWKGKWIGDSTQQEVVAENKTSQAQPSPRFRKSFDMDKPIKDATLFISGIGYYEAWLNGERVGDHVLDPAFTRYDKGVLYVAHDVGDQLINGDNAIGVQLGNGWYNMHTRAVWDFDKAPWRASPRMIMQLNVTYTDGSEESVVTDKSWKMSRGPFVFDSIRNGEVYDARLESPGWDEKGFDESRWEQADEVDAPKGVLRSQMMPPIRVTQTMKAKRLSQPQPGVYVFDLGQNIAGWVKLKLRGPRGTKVTLRYSERLDDKGMIDQKEIAKHLRGGNIQEDIYILKGGGVEERQTHFSYHGFQYVEVSGLAEKPSLDDIEGVVVHTDFETIGEFECSNKLINDIHNLALWAYRGNYHGYPTDCPHREKNGWSGDAHLAAEMGLFNFRQGASYSKWIDDWADEQQEDGTVAAIIPTSGWGYKWGNGPAWDSAYVLIPWYMYLYNGDTRILEDHYDGMKKYVDRMGKWANKDKYIVDYGLGDWAPAKTKTSRNLTSTGYYFVDAQIISKAADILGKTADQKKYSDLADAIRGAFNKHFYKGSGTYEKGSQTANSCALYQGLAEKNEIQHIVNKLVADINEKDEHLDVGILGCKYLFNALTENGQHDLAYRMVTKTTGPSYGHWVALGASTMWEHWKGGQSLNHIMFGDIDAWFYKNLAGINYDGEKPGFKNIIVHPRPTGDLTWAKAEYQSPYGLIKTSWEIKNNKFYLDITVPANTTATVYVPAKNGDGVSESGKTANNAEGVKFVKMIDGGAVYGVGSGSYRFSSVYDQSGTDR